MKIPDPAATTAESNALTTPPLMLMASPVKKKSVEFVLTETMHGGEAVADVFYRLAESLDAKEAQLLSVMIYGSLASRIEIDAAMRRALGATQWPVTWVEGESCDGLPLAGVQAFAISGRPVTRVRIGDLIVGSVYEDAGARHCLLGGVGPTALTLGVGAQVQQTFGNLEWALDQAGFAFSDIVRTWFYNDDILAWYGEFNRVRSAHYANIKFRTGSLPASTGIGARNAAGAALTVAAWAVRPIGEGARAREIGSPLQCPAPAYGSSFSRAMEINSGGWRRLLISGTASIHPGGKTAWVGDARKQVDLTMEVIAGILQARGMDYRDVTRATAYYRESSYLPAFQAWCAERNLEAMPVVHTHSVVCRDDLLFELELDACASEI
jgi:enamine deaminase RidA (YjgF/YER057c/UK114 family)